MILHSLHLSGHFWGCFKMSGSNILGRVLAPVSLSESVEACHFLVHAQRSHSYFLSLNRGIEAYLFCMCSLAESAIAYRAECALMRGGGGCKGTEKRKKGRERRREGGEEGGRGLVVSVRIA